MVRLSSGPATRHRRSQTRSHQCPAQRASRYSSQTRNSRTWGKGAEPNAVTAVAQNSRSSSYVLKSRAVDLDLHSFSFLDPDPGGEKKKKCEENGKLYNF